jgi:hypothetical protein
VPSSVSEADLENEFKKFGRLIPDGVAIRSRKVVPYMYFLLRDMIEFSFDLVFV